MRGRLGTRRPVDQNAGIVGARVAVVGVEQHHERRLQPFRCVHSQDLRGIQAFAREFGVDGIRRFSGIALHTFVGAFIFIALTDGAQLGHELGQARVAATVEVERELEECIKVGKHLFAIGGGCTFGVTALKLAGVDDVVKQIVHRQRGRHCQPA